jgi:hypothetical protein
MTAFDDHLIARLAELAPTGSLVVTAAELAELCDCSDDTIRRALRRLTDTDRIEVIHILGRGMRLRLPGGFAEGAETPQYTPPPLKGGCGVGAYTPAETPHTPRTPPGRPTAPEKSTTPTLPRARPDCPLCEGVGWQFTDDTMTTVIACTCRGPETRAHHRHRARDNAASWGSPAPSSLIAAKADFTKVWRDKARGELADAINRHPAGDTA